MPIAATCRLKSIHSSSRGKERSGTELEPSGMIQLTWVASRRSSRRAAVCGWITVQGGGLVVKVKAYLEMTFVILNQRANTRVQEAAAAKTIELTKTLLRHPQQASYARITAKMSPAEDTAATEAIDEEEVTSTAVPGSSSGAATSPSSRRTACNNLSS